MVSRFKDLPPYFQERAEVTDDGCWTWTLALNHNGYAECKPMMGTKRAHRITYMLLVGEIPEGLVLDHLCRVRHCINPDHLEPVTDRENLDRGFALITACPQGHEYTPENTYLKP